MNLLLDKTQIGELESQPFIDRQARIVAPGQIGRHIDATGNERVCQWPMWGEEAKSGHVCGLARWDRGDKKAKTRYCEFHHSKAYPAAAALK